MTNNSHYIYIVQEFVGCGYTIGHIAQQHRIAEWKNIRAFSEEHEAEKYMGSLQKQNKSLKYSVEEVLLDVPQETL